MEHEVMAHIETRESWAVRKGTFRVGRSLNTVETVCGGEATHDVYPPHNKADVYNYEEIVEVIEGLRGMKSGSPPPCRDCMRLIAASLEATSEQSRAIQFLEMGLKDYGDQIYTLSAELDRWKDMMHRTSQGRDENYRAYQQELRSNRALQARLDEALLSWTTKKADLEVKEATIGRLEAEVKRLGRNVQRGSYGRSKA